jgi:acid phosphatase family membrane protein YuiD
MNYNVLLIPLAAGLIAQGLKFLVRSNHQKLDWRNLIAYSGMPSAHSAMIVALATIIGLEEGFFSSLFAISAIMTIIIIRDALGIRRILGQHGRILNILVKDLKDDDLLDKRYPRLLEKVGHTPSQVIVGSFLGLIIGLIGYLFF